ncbi:hypothetical protein EYF80_060551 [Liparis tanakae]|uniref:Uncharacterized protein n=1 Tax=Liparis tanakae TaxID=230148 RepID=A0A4Z2EL53_9TELE|nr:hypothetical protein EYF80_060551 [Liparis tanakae]
MSVTDTRPPGGGRQEGSVLPMGLRGSPVLLRGSPVLLRGSPVLLRQLPRHSLRLGKWESPGTEAVEAQNAFHWLLTQRVTR